MPFIQIVSELSREYGWGPRDWRLMGWLELQTWVAELARTRREAERAEAEAEHRRVRQAAADEFFRQHGVRG